MRSENQDIIGEKCIRNDDVLGSSIQITNEMMQASINHLKSGKAEGPSGIVVEMLKKLLVIV